MASDQPKNFQVVVRFSNREIEALDAMMLAHGYETRSQTIRALVRGGFVQQKKGKGVAK